MTLVEFLTCRWFELETIARHTDQRDRVHALADLAAKQRILAEHLGDDEIREHQCMTCYGVGFVDWPCPTVRLLAVPFADHPDYDEAWRPEDDCRRCHGPRGDWSAPSSRWDQVMRDDDGRESHDGLVCVFCFLAIAEKRGIHVAPRWRQFEHTASRSWSFGDGPSADSAAD